MNYKYFLGCANYDEVKTKWKELAKKHHPDKGGKHEVFVEIKAEYDYIISNSISYPIAANIFGEVASIFDVFEKMARKEEEKRRQQARNTQMSFQQAQYARIFSYFQNKRKDDVNYQIIDGIIEEASDKDKTVQWLLFEVNKLDDLGLDHFKYLQWRMNLKDPWAKDAYSVYLKTKLVKW